ncbi:alpha-1,6-glucosidase domain-containing protein [Lysobacter niastensis]|uniref:DUF3372 domain-containing protein n=1 Tax=Lysobacter niastensis TaxID=380629 RepID=A0ABS0B8F3_9GAMM|nr:alpha-1,6-glucosidase domain-containing protein [Lysobacter niastensis]MBF6025301.1 DUF3372 domain-containing protein [Lysobacter niastensis]
MHRLARAAPLVLFVASLSAQAGDAENLKACEGDYQTVLHAAPAEATPQDARAYWLDRSLLQWPQPQGSHPSGRYRLYHSAIGKIMAQPGQRVAGADGALTLRPHAGDLPKALAERFRFVAPGPVLSLDEAGVARLPSLLTGQLVLVHEDAAGRVLDATATQLPGALDDLYADASGIDDLGATVTADRTTFRLWAPTAQDVSVCLFERGDAGVASARIPLQRDDDTGAWSASRPLDLSGRYYAYLVDVYAPGAGIVRNRVTDPYSISLTTDSARSYVGDLSSAALKPEGWDTDHAPGTERKPTDAVIYELHVRDFSRDDATVSAANRGKYLAFAERDSAGMRHLRALAQAGLTDVHLLPVFDFAGVPETGCAVPDMPRTAADSEAQQDAVMAVAARDCFNWGYEPFHFNAPEGSYASDASDGARRVIEFRKMVMALHQTGLRVGMDVVYNHMTASGRHPWSVLDRIVPGYYHRLDARGAVERSTCCANTATEHAMMGKLMIDSTVLWAREYGIDSFRFDLMGHQPRAVMEALDRAVDAATDRDVQLIGEGWNFGEVADGARFVQASQASLNGSGIGTFSDRARDALRGGSPGDHGDALVSAQGWLNGLAESVRPASERMHAADLVRVGLAGTLRDYTMTASDDRTLPLSAVDYKGQPAGYASQPSEVVNYVENHDNQTLFDLNAFKLPPDTSREDRARVQLLGAAVTALSQGIAYFHAGIDTLRSKSMDRNSYDSGDWFNRLDWSYRDNHFGTGAPPRTDNAADYALIKPRLADASIKPSPREIAFMRDGFRDWLRIRASSPLFRLGTAEEIRQRLSFPDAGPGQNPVMIAGHLDGSGMPDAVYREAIYLINAGTTPQSLSLPAQAGKHYELHPALREGADRRAREARYEPGAGRFTVPARTAVVFVVE